MGDMGDLFNAIRDSKREMNAKYQAVGLPRDLGLVRVCRNIRIIKEHRGGLHVVLEVDATRTPKTVDWWTETGRWVIRGGRGGFGIPALLKHFKLSDERSDCEECK